jgi:hypothetical protein
VIQREKELMRLIVPESGVPQIVDTQKQKTKNMSIFPGIEDFDCCVAKKRFIISREHLIRADLSQKAPISISKSSRISRKKIYRAGLNSTMLKEDGLKVRR